MNLFSLSRASAETTAVVIFQRGKPAVSSSIPHYLERRSTWRETHGQVWWTLKGVPFCVQVAEWKVQWGSLFLRGSILCSHTWSRLCTGITAGHASITLRRFPRHTPDEESHGKKNDEKNTSSHLLRFGHHG